MERRNNKVAVVIPYYHSDLSELEMVSYKQCLKKLKNYPIILVVPDTMPRNEYPKDSQLIFETVPSEWLTGIDTYNQMMVKDDFYKRFEKYEYILIYQLDAIVFEDRLDEFCDYGYDYIGAPWLRGAAFGENIYYVGNGGFSLRRISSFLKMLSQKKTINIDIAEDVFWASHNSDCFRVAPIEVAVDFSFEEQVKRCFQLNHCRIPFGCHAWAKFDYLFWKRYLDQEGYKISTTISGDLDSIMEKEQERRRIEKKIKAILENSIYDNNRKVLKCCEEYFGWRDKIVYIWGAGKRGEEVGSIFNSIGFRDFCYVDVNKEKQGKKIGHAEIRKPDEVLHKKEAGLVIIAVKDAEKEILEYLEKKGFCYGKTVFLYQNLFEALAKIDDLE